MTESHLEVLVEEQSMQACLDSLLPRIVPQVNYSVRVFGGKGDLLKKLPSRLAGYRHWPESPRLLILVVVDRDDDDCVILRQKMDGIASAAGFAVSSHKRNQMGKVLNRIAVEELEAWFFGDIPALVAAYGVASSLGDRARYRNPDAIRGGTWESLERELRSHGHPGGLEKVRAAREIAVHMNVDHNSSRSFQSFRDGLRYFVEAST